MLRSLWTWGAFCAACLCGGSAFAVVTSGTGGSGVTVGSSSLIGQLEYGDTFTGTPDGSANASRPYAAAIQPAAAYTVEGLFGNPSTSWSNAFSFASDRDPARPGFFNGVPVYPGLGVGLENTSGSGSLTGFTQTGNGVDYGASMSHGNHFVAQFDAIQVGDRIDITSSNSPGAIFGSNTLSVFFRTNGHAAADIGVFNGAAEVDTGLNTGILAPGSWHNYAVKFNRPANQIEVFVDEVSRGTYNLPVSHQNYGTTAVSFGAGLAGGEDRTWTDNAQVGNAIGFNGVQPQTSSLISYWSFDEASSGSTVAFDGQHANNGVAANLHTAGLTGTGAALINGVAGNSVNVGPGGGNNFSTPNGITIESLFTIPVTYTVGTESEFFRKDDGGNRILLSLQSDGNTNNASGQLVGTDIGFAGISFGLDTAGYKEMDVALDGLAGRPTLAQLADGREHHIAVSYDAATGVKSMYIDGVLVASIDGPDGVSIVDGGGALAYIGSSGGVGEVFPGVLDEMAIFASALSANDIAQHYERSFRGLNYFTSVTALPEPSTWAMFGLVSLLGIGYAARSRKQRKAK